MPEKELQHIDEPTFDKVRAACGKPDTRVTVLARNDVPVTCRTEVKHNVATINFNLWRLGTNFSEEAQKRFSDKLKPYLTAKVKKFDRRVKSASAWSFGATGIRFHVLATDANKWFDEVYEALLEPKNFTALPDPFEKVKKSTATAPTSKAAETDDESDQPKERKTIPPETIRAFYPIVRRVAKGELHRPTGISQLVEKYGLNENSARDFIDNFRKMLKGEEYQRFYSISATEYLLERIEEEFGQDALRKAVSAVQQHINYTSALEKNKSTQPTIQAMLKRKYSHLLTTPSQEDRKAVQQRAEELEKEGEFDPNNDTDTRRWVLRAIASRQGQPEFRSKLLKAYGNCCAISGCTIESLLEAAHILRFKGSHRDHTTNGLLLRTDLHTLFDLHLIAIDHGTMKVVVSSELEGTEYEYLGGTDVRPPDNAKQCPNPEALQKHREDCGF